MAILEKITRKEFYTVELLPWLGAVVTVIVFAFMTFETQNSAARTDAARVAQIAVVQAGVDQVQTAGDKRLDAVVLHMDDGFREQNRRIDDINKTLILLMRSK